MGTGQPLWRRLEVLKSFILKVRLMTPLIHVWATAEEDGAEFIPAAGYPEPAAHTHIKSVNMHTHTQRHTQLLCTQTRFLVGHLICQVSIWPQVVMKLEAVARILAVT